MASGSYLCDTGDVVDYVELCKTFICGGSLSLKTSVYDKVTFLYQTPLE